MVDIILPYHHSRWHDTELIYALRSVEKHLSGYGELFIIGDQPKGLTNYTHIPFTDDHRPVYKEANIFNKLMAAVGDERVSENFLYMNDDHFLLRDYDAATFPNYYGVWPEGRSDMYATTIANTKAILPEGRFYDVHCPMVFNKQTFASKVASADWTKKCGYCMKTLYAHDLPGEFYGDLKIRYIEKPARLREMIRGGYWFSTDDGARGPELMEVLGELYPNQSRWEH